MVDVEYSVEYAVCNFRAGGLFYAEDDERMFLRNIHICMYQSIWYHILQDNVHHKTPFNNYK